MTVLAKHSDFARRYIPLAPLSLALERTLECRLHAQREFERPVLDLGCGDGLFAHVLFAEPVDTGVDPDERELAHAKRLRAYGELLSCRGDAVPKPDHSYRTILSNSVLEHIPGLPAVLKEMHRLLAPGGRFYVTVPSDQFDDFAVPCQLLRMIGLHRLAQSYLRLANRFWKLYNLHPRAEWEGIFRAAGFRVLESRDYDPKPMCLLNGCLVPPALFSYVCKRLTRRWTWFTTGRRWLLAPIFPVVERILRRAEQSPQGALVYLVLTK